MHQYLARNQFNGQHKQRGASMIAIFLLVAMILFILLVAMKIVPAYTEYMNIKRVLKAMGEENINGMSNKEIKESFGKRISINDVTAVRTSDLVIEQDETGKTVASVEYQAVRPVMGNVSVVIDFKASSSD